MLPWSLYFPEAAGVSQFICESITNGIGFGFITYTLIRIAQGDWRRINPLLYAISAGFVLYFLVPLLQDNLSWV